MPHLHPWLLLLRMCPRHLLLMFIRNLFTCSRLIPHPTIMAGGDGTMIEIYSGWQCIGCGKIDVDRPCVGICQDRPVRVVLAEDYEHVLERNKLLESLVRRLVHSKPHPDAWEASFKALQSEAIALSRGQN